MQPAIVTEGLSKRFRKLQTYRDLVLYPWRRASSLAVDGISLCIDQGEFFGILGPNGAGKTTLIKMLCTTVLPSGGSARVAGYDVVRQVRQVRASIGLITSEERSFYWRLTGRQNLEFFAALYRLPAATAQTRIDELLERVGLTEHADRPFQAYSTGMRQKLGIARGLLHQPAIVFMDEPTRSLDPLSAQAVRQLIKEYVVDELGRTVVLATHSMPEAEELCDRVALVQAGRVVAEGSVGQLQRALGPGICCDLRVGNFPAPLSERLDEIPGVVELTSTTEEDIQHIRLTLTDEGRVLAAVLREVVGAGGDVYGCTTRQISLEEIYMRTLGEPQERVKVS